MGCTDIMHYNSYALEDDNSCVEYVYGCTNSLSFNYNELANTDDYSVRTFYTVVQILTQ